MIILKTISRYLEYSGSIPFKLLLEQEKIIRLNCFNEESSIRFRKNEVNRYMCLSARVSDDTYRQLIVLSNFKELSESELVENYLNLHILANLIGKDDLSDDHRQYLRIYAHEIAFRNLGMKVEFTYRSY